MKWAEAFYLFVIGFLNSKVSASCTPSPIYARVSNDLLSGSCVKMPTVTCEGWGPDDKPTYHMILDQYFAAVYNNDGLYMCTLQEFHDVIRTFKGNLTILHTNNTTDVIPVIINTVEINDPPIIKSFTATLPEDTPKGWSYEITVTDPDSGLWGHIGVFARGLSSPFHLRKDGSTYHIVLDGNLDAEMTKKYSFKIEALDGGGEKSEADVTITVIDVNDNKPECKQSDELRLSLTANLATPVVYLPDVCSDKDISPANQIVSYEIKDIENCENGFVMMPDHTIMVRRPPSPNQTFCVIHLAVSDRDFTTHVALKVFLVGCRPSLDERGLYWGVSWPGWKTTKSCPKGYTGNVTRECTKESVYKDPIYRCTQLAINSVKEEIQAIQNGTGNATISESLEKLVKVTNTTQLRLQEGDIRTVEDILTTVVNVSSVSELVQHKETDVFLDIASNLLDENNTESWKSLLATEGNGANTLLEIIEDFVETIKPRILKRDTSSGTPLLYSKPSLVVQVGETSKCQEKIEFPDRLTKNSLPTWATSVTNGIRMDCKTAMDSSTYSGALYKDVSNIVANRFGNKGDVTDVKSSVTSFKLSPRLPEKLDPPVEMTFTLSGGPQIGLVCGFWNTSLSNGSGAWSTDGCWLKYFHGDQVVCACNHLTNFAILMSPSKTPSTHNFGLSIISITGCGISMVCLMATIALYTIFWRTVQSDRSSILMNLCCMLFLAYLVFLIGIKQTQNQGLCTSVAVILHYIYLVVFFLMLAEGLDLARSVILVSSSRHVGWKLILPAWIIPAAIVGLTMLLTRLEGYGNREFCWLEVGGSIFWAFAGPVILVIVVNVIVIVVVLRKMFSTSKMKNKTEFERTMVGVRSLCVLLPIMGVTWIIGLFSVNEDMVAFQYAFAILNSLQGLFIFIFHCVMNRKIRDALKQIRTKRRRRALLGSELQTYARSQDTLATLA